MKTPDQPAHPLTRDLTHLNAARAELIGLRAALTAEREKSERYRLATLKLDAELAAEREKVRVLREALENLRDEQNGAPLCTREKQWNQAMAKADLALATTEDAQ
jgi:predicted  nucleic acid-binding Zn-ribbon protein